MKFFHLSDLHIGLKLMERDLREDQEYIFSQIIELAKQEKPDAFVIAGDIYDKAIPSAEAMEIFDDFIKKLLQEMPKLSVMIISGNHDSAGRLNCFRTILSRQNVYMIGMPPRKEGEKIEKVTLEDAYGKVNFYLLPFVKPSMVRELVGTKEDGTQVSYDEALHRLICREEISIKERNVLVSHQFYLPSGKKADEIERMDSEIRTVGNIDEISSDILEIFDYAALGHIHKPMKVGKEQYRYCGTPLACSVSEAGQKKSILMITMEEKGKLQIAKLPLTPLRQIKVLKGTLEEVLEEACEDYVTVILTDKNERDALDIKDRLHHAFPYLLEIRREQERTIEYAQGYEKLEEVDPFTICCSFLGENVDEEEREFLATIIAKVQGVK